MSDHPPINLEHETTIRKTFETSARTINRQHETSIRNYSKHMLEQLIKEVIEQLLNPMFETSVEAITQQIT